jgi:hypothetical protein
MAWNMIPSMYSRDSVVPAGLSDAGCTNPALKRWANIVPSLRDGRPARDAVHCYRTDAISERESLVVCEGRTVGDGCGTRIAVVAKGASMSWRDFGILLLFAVLVAGTSLGQAKPTAGKASTPAGAPVIVPVDKGPHVPIDVVPIDQEPSHKLVFENEYVRVFSVEVAPRSETKYHRHERDSVGVILGDAEVESVRVGEAPVRLMLKDADANFTKGGFAHKAVNKSDRPFRNVLVELKKMVVDAIAGPMTVVDGHSSRTTVLLSKQVTCKVIKGLNAIRSWDPLDSKKKSLLVAAGPSAMLADPKGPSIHEKVLKSGDIKWVEFPKGLIAVAIGNSSGLAVCEFAPIETQGNSRG